MSRLFRNKKKVSVKSIGISALTLALVSCFGFGEYATDIMDNSATLNAKYDCSGNAENPCTGWFQYWKNGDSSTSNIVKTRVVTLSRDIRAEPFFQKVEGLEPDTLYHFQYCGYGDDNLPPPGYCTSPLLANGNWAGTNRPNQFPPTNNNHSLTGNFRTASNSTVKNGTVDLGILQSVATTSENRILNRDGGVSVALPNDPNKSLWIFGDTVINYGYNFLPGSTAAIGTNSREGNSGVLKEVPTPTLPHQDTTSWSLSDSPHLFLPSPAYNPNNPNIANNLINPADGSDCNSDSAYQASWINGAVHIKGTNDIAITYSKVCVFNGLNMSNQGAAIAIYDPVLNHFREVYSPFNLTESEKNLLTADNFSVLPSQKTLGSPVYGNDGYLYFYPHDNASLEAAASSFIVRVQLNSDLNNENNYEWWVGKNSLNQDIWSNDYKLAKDFLLDNMNVSINIYDYSDVGNENTSFVLISQTSFAEEDISFDLYTSPSLTGPWNLKKSSKLPANCSMNSSSIFVCYALYGHPEFSSSEKFVYSWFDHNDKAPDADERRGNIHLGSIEW